MKRIYRVRDDFGGKIEVYLLNKNNKVPEDLIWLHIKRKGVEEVDLTMKPDEARYIIHALFLAIDAIIDKYKLEKFKV